MDEIKQLSLISWSLRIRYNRGSAIHGIKYMEISCTEGNITNYGWKYLTSIIESGYITSQIMMNHYFADHLVFVPALHL